MVISPAIAPHLAPSATLFINEQVRAKWAAGETVYHFGFGESRFSVHPKLMQALADNAHHKSYPPLQGVPELREAIAAYDRRTIGVDCTADQIFIGPGSKALIFALQMALAGDLLIPTPSWVTYEPQAKFLGKQTHFIDASVEDGYQLHLENIDAAVQKANPGQKILILCTPHNPTGLMLGDQFLRELADYCRQNQIIVLSDEIYSAINHGIVPHISLAKYYPEGTIVLGGISKHMSLGGWRLGRAVFPKELKESLLPAVMSIGSEIWSGVNGPTQYAAVHAFANDPEMDDYIETCSAIHATRTQHMWSWFNELGIQVAQPQGAFYMMPNFDRWREPLAAKGVHTAKELAQYLLDHHQCAFLPGTPFGTPAEDLSLRMACGFVDMETDEAADAVLTAWHVNPDPAVFMDGPHPMTAGAMAQMQAFVESLG